MPLSLVINDGAAQRSKISKLTITTPSGEVVVVECGSEFYRLLADCTFTVTCGSEQLSGHSLLADFNGDGVVGGDDYDVFGGTYGLSADDPNFNPLADFNGDEVVDIDDYEVFHGQFGISV